MAIHTNMTVRLINAPDGTQLAPGVPTEVSDETMAHEGMQEMLASGDIVAGPPPVEAAPPEDQPSPPFNTGDLPPDTKPPEVPITTKTTAPTVSGGTTTTKSS